MSVLEKKQVHELLEKEELINKLQTLLLLFIKIENKEVKSLSDEVNLKLLIDTKIVIDLLTKIADIVSVDFTPNQSESTTKLESYGDALNRQKEFLKALTATKIIKQSDAILNPTLQMHLDKILTEDNNLLHHLAQ